MKLAKPLVAMMIFAAASSAFASTATPAVTDRQVNQAQRIRTGVATGELTKAEATTLRTEQKAIRAEKRAFKADGTVTAAERAQLRRDQNRASRDIYRKKHNAVKVG